LLAEVNITSSELYTFIKNSTQLVSFTFIKAFQLEIVIIQEVVDILNQDIIHGHANSWLIEYTG